VNRILQQTYKNIEIILVNDGSPDRSGEICEMLAKQDNRVKVIHKSNGGVCNARNVGLDIAKGEFIAFVDHDDTMDVNMYEIMHNQIIDSDADICISGVNQFVDGKTRTITIPHKKVFTPAALIEAYLDNYKYFPPFFQVWNKLIRKNLLQGEAESNTNKIIRFREDALAGEDCCFIADCLSVACSYSKVITTINVPLYNYMTEVNNDSLYRTYVFDDFNKCAEHLRKMMITILPHRSIDIDKAIFFQECDYILFKLHKGIISRNKSEYKLKWRTVNAVLHATTRFETKISALLMYFFPKSLYRLIFKIYRFFRKFSCRTQSDHACEKKTESFE